MRAEQYEGMGGEGRLCRDEERAPREEGDCTGSRLGPGASFPRPPGGLKVLTRLAALDAAAICPQSCSFPSLSPPPASPTPSLPSPDGFHFPSSVFSLTTCFTVLSLRGQLYHESVCLGPGQGLIHPVTPCPALCLAHARVEEVLSR